MLLQFFQLLIWMNNSYIKNITVHTTSELCCECTCNWKGEKRVWVVIHVIHVCHVCMYCCAYIVHDFTCILIYSTTIPYTPTKTRLFTFLHIHQCAQRTTNVQHNRTTLVSTFTIHNIPDSRSYMYIHTGTCMYTHIHDMYPGTSTGYV